MVQNIILSLSEKKITSKRGYLNTTSDQMVALLWPKETACVTLSSSALISGLIVVEQ